MDELDVCVVGAGVVGLAIGKSLAKAGREVVVLESESHFGEGVSSRNSEVIHAGIYYPKDSLKALMCVEGKHRLYEYCLTHNVGHQRCGKLIVATSAEEEGVLEGIKQKADDNGVADLEYWGPERLRAAEPELKSTLALFSPSTGIVSSHELMAAYLGDLEAAGSGYVRHTKMVGAEVQADGFVVRMSSGGDAEGRGGEGDEDATKRTVTRVSLRRAAEPGRRAKWPRRSSRQGPSLKTASCGRRPLGRGRAAAGRRVHGKRARVRHLRRRRRRGGRTAARTRAASAGGGAPLALPPADREEGRVGQGLRVGKPATAARRTSGNRGRRAMAIGGESCGARRRCIGYGV